MDIFDSICHSLSTVPTGGFFLPKGGSWTGSKLIGCVVTLFMFLGGVNFNLIYEGISWRLAFIAAQYTLCAYINIHLL